MSDLEFSKTDIAEVITDLCGSKIDIVELGSVEITDTPRTGFAIYPDIESIFKTMLRNKPTGQIYAVLYRGSDRYSRMESRFV